MKSHATLIFGTIITILSGLILTTSYVSADDVVDDINFTVPVSCTMSGTGMNTHNATINNGQYNSAIGETIIKTLCNDSNGFAIYAIGYTDNTDGVNVLASSTLGSSFDITTGTATSGNASKWAMKLSTITSPTPTYPITIQNSFDSFHNVPDDYTLVAKRTSGTDVGSSAEGASLKTTYQAYISPTQPAGTYTGQVKYTLVHPNDASAPEMPFACPANYICYHPNGNDVVGTMNVLDINTSYRNEGRPYAGDTTSTIGYQEASSNSSVLLYSSNYSRAGYGFGAWNTAEDGTGTNYGPNQTITTGSLSPRGLNLYAKWVLAESNVTMQTFDATVSPYSIAPIGTVIALTDTRDNNVYTVAKLADGKWWMVESLRLNPGTANITSSNTNNPTSTFLQGIQNSTSTSAWCDSYSTACTDQIVYNTSNLDRSLDPNPLAQWDENWNDIEDTSWYSYGVYYNWYTATAGHGDASFIGGQNIEHDQIDYRYAPNVRGDICPTGWRLPPAMNTSDEFQMENYDDVPPSQGSVAYLFHNRFTFRESPNNFVLSGSYNDSYSQSTERGKIIHLAGGSDYWTATIGAFDNTGPTVLDMPHENQDCEYRCGLYDGSKIKGYPIRCIAQ